jgi:predicted GTPase
LDGAGHSRLFDTAACAGSRASGQARGLAVADALNAIRFAEVVSTIDVSSRSSRTSLLRTDQAWGRAIAMALTKWDLVVSAGRRSCAASAMRLLPQLADAPLVPVSGVTGGDWTGY